MPPFKILFSMYAAIMLGAVLYLDKDIDEQAIYKTVQELEAKHTGNLLHDYVSKYPNYGYGLIYWNGYIYLYQAFGDTAFWIVRLLNWLMMLCIPLLLLRLNGWLALLWLLCPLAWQLNKLSGPEIPQLFCYMLAAALLLDPRRMKARLLLAWLLVGIGLGIKLNAPYIVLLFMAMGYGRVRDWALAAVVLVVGVFIALPVAFLHFGSWLELMELFAVGNRTELFLEPLFSMGYRNQLFQGGLLNFMPAVVLLFFAPVKRSRILLSWLVVLVLHLVQFYLTQRYFSWYLYPIMGLLLFVFAQSKPQAPRWVMGLLMLYSAGMVVYQFVVRFGLFVDGP